ncbi:hypothetical protein Patl1_30603 [Pistacia atlantica]|uniref:Uncharacterized protein n=1 Tax=Pistacia atlantica TaxID=434234 RepID=A0ACC1A847_9ROSI|nr:hypothetical protein Patl1_30603 [Pistacia atlantica]
MEIQESHHSWHESWSETDNNPGSNRVGYNGPLSGPITSNSKKTHSYGKKTTIVCDSLSSTIASPSPSYTGKRLRDPGISLLGRQAHLQGLRYLISSYPECLNILLFAANEESGDVTYEAESPNEGAFLVVAREFGFEFCKRTQSSVFIREIYHSSGQPTQSIIFYRLSKNGRMYEEVTTRHLNEYGEDGLHTLALAYRKLDESEYTSWNHEFLKATQYQSANIIKCYWDWRLGGVFGGGVVGFMGGGEGCIEAAGVGVFPGAMADSLRLIFCLAPFYRAFYALLRVFLGSCVVATAVLLLV